MIIILIGPPGAGKGTQGDFLASSLGAKKISTGDLLRNEVKCSTSLGKKVENVLKAGKLVSDDLLYEIVKQSLEKEKRVILDGYPRTLRQAEDLQSFSSRICCVIHFDVGLDVITKRLVDRCVCSSCGAIYHRVSSPTKVEAVCDKCGAAVGQRSDDGDVEKIVSRFQIYERETKPLLSLYKDVGLYERIEASKSAGEVTKRLGGLVSKLKLALKSVRQ